MSFWSKISGLNKELLNQEGEEVSIITATEESKAKKIRKPRKKEEKSAEDWLPEETQGQLSVDIYEDDDCLIIESMIAGVQAKGYRYYYRARFNCYPRHSVTNQARKTRSKLLLSRMFLGKVF